MGGRISPRPDLEADRVADGSADEPRSLVRTSSWSRPLEATTVPRRSRRAPSKSVTRPPASSMRTERRGEVPCLRVDLDHRLGGALGEQRVAPEVAEAPFAPDSPSSASEARAPGPLASMSRPRAVQDLGILERSDARHADPPRRRSLPAAPTAHAPPPRQAYQRSRERRRGHDRRPGARRRARRASSVPNSGHAADEVVGAVDRVDVPADRARRRPPCRTPRRRGRGPGTRPGSDRGSAARSPVSACGHERPVGLGR